MIVNEAAQRRETERKREKREGNFPKREVFFILISKERKTKKNQKFKNDVSRRRPKQRKKSISIFYFLYSVLVHRTLRPFLRRALSTPRPVGVAILARKPDVRVARRRVPRLVQPRQVFALASTVSGEREGEEVEGLVEVAGLRAGARETPGGLELKLEVVKRREEEGEMKKGGKKTFVVGGRRHRLARDLNRSLERNASRIAPLRSFSIHISLHDVDCRRKHSSARRKRARAGATRSSRRRRIRGPTRFLFAVGRRRRRCRGERATFADECDPFQSFCRPSIDVTRPHFAFIVHRGSEEEGE